jgi:TPR repeat protein
MSTAARRIALAALLALAAVPVLAGAALAQTADREARLGWVRERFQSENAHLETLVNDKTPEALLELGELLVDGALISPENPLRKPDPAGARAAFEEGLKVPSEIWPSAAANLASIILAGEGGYDGGVEDIAKGLDLLERAARLGYGKGAYQLGLDLQMGLGGAARTVEAPDLYRLAARLQYAPAAFALARMLGFETAAGRDLVASGLVLFDLYAPRSRDLLVAYGDIQRDGAGIPADAEKAAENYRRAFALGSGKGALRLSELLLSNALGPPDPGEARRVLEEAAWSGSTLSAIRLAEDFVDQGPMGIEEDAAKIWLGFAREVEDYRAFLVAARMFETGRGEPLDLVKAREMVAHAIEIARPSLASSLSVARAAQGMLVADALAGEIAELLKRAAERGNIEGMAGYGAFVAEKGGIGGVADGAQAVQWLRQAADAGNPQAMLTLGDFLREGKYVPPSAGEAVELYRDALAIERSTGALLRNGDVLVSGEGGGVDVKQALELYREAANRGSASAKLKLGRLLMRGGPVQRDPDAARALLEEAVRAGDQKAPMLLADFYSGVFGDTPAPAEAERILRAAVDQGNPEAPARLAKVLVDDGRPQEAVAALERAATAGQPDALVELALLSLSGTAGRRDPDAAEAYLARADELGGASPQARIKVAVALLDVGRAEATQKGIAALTALLEGGSGSAAAALSHAYRDGRGVARDTARAEELAIEAARLGVTDALIEIASAYEKQAGDKAAQRRAFELFGKAAEYEPGSARALGALARAYRYGRGTEQDLPLSVEYFRKAADAGSASALTALATAYTEGSGVARDPAEARRLLLLAVDRGIDGAYVDLGRFYLSGFGGEIDPERAVVSFSRAAAAGNLDGDLELARAFISGYGITRNVAEGVRLLEKAAEGGVAEAMIKLYELYANGFDVPVDQTKALAWLERAAETNDDALKRLLEVAHTDPGIDPATAERWRIRARQRGIAVPDDKVSATGAPAASAASAPAAATPTSGAGIGAN